MPWNFSTCASASAKRGVSCCKVAAMVPRREWLCALNSSTLLLPSDIVLPFPVQLHLLSPVRGRAPQRKSPLTDEREWALPTHATGTTPIDLDLLYAPSLRHVTSYCINRFQAASRIDMPM